MASTFEEYFPELDCNGMYKDKEVIKKGTRNNPVSFRCECDGSFFKTYSSMNAHFVSKCHKDHLVHSSIQYKDEQIQTANKKKETERAKRHKERELRQKANQDNQDLNEEINRLHQGFHQEEVEKKEIIHEYDEKMNEIDKLCCMEIHKAQEKCEFKKAELRKERDAKLESK